MSRTRLFNARKYLSSWAFWIHRSCESTWFTLLAGELFRFVKSQKIGLPTAPIGISSVLPKTLGPVLKPSYCRAWEFMYNIIDAIYSCQSTGLICLSVGRSGSGSAVPQSRETARSSAGSHGGRIIGERSVLGAPSAKPAMRDLFRAPAKVLRPIIFLWGF